jgi:hypothetical protein
VTEVATPELGRELSELGYGRLFQSMRDPLEGIESSPADLASLRQIVQDPNAPLKQRFLAAEVLFRVDKRFPPREQREEVAHLYVQALREGVVPAANAWSFPGELDGPAGKHLVSLGSAAEPELIEALGDNSRVTYDGSREASIGNSYKYRVKDIAWQLLRAIRGQSLEPAERPAQRDREIQALRKDGGRAS